MTDFSLKIYGCRGSIPVSGAEHVRYGGETSCAVVKAGSRTIVLDAGSGIRRYGNDIEGRDPRVYLFVSHVHFDHIIGLPYFGALYRPDATVSMWGPSDPHGNSFEHAIETLLQPPFHPISIFEMLAKKKFYNIGESQVVYFLKGQEDPIQLNPAHPDDRSKIPSDDEVEVKVSCMRGYNHPKSGVNIYRIDFDGKSLIYASDTEGYVQGDRRLIEFSQGADVLIHDAMYTDETYVAMPVPTQGYGHSTVKIACQAAEDAGVKKLVLWHHDPSSTDDELDAVFEHAKANFSDCIIGKDGMEIYI